MASLTTISESGLTLYFVIRDHDSLVWNTTTLALEAFSSGNYATKYGNAAGEQGTTGYYYGGTPATLPAGHYRIDWRSQAGASPAQSDEPVAFGSAYWDGANWLPDWATKIAIAVAPVVGSIETYVDCLPAAWVVPASVADIPTAAQIWQNPTRTLTMSAAQIAAIVAGSDLTLQRGDTLTIALTGLGNISARTKLWFTVKDRNTKTDAQAKLLVEETLGLEVLEGSDPAVTETSTLVVTNAVTGAVTITISAAASLKLTPTTTAVWDMQMLTAAGVVTTLTQGTVKVMADITRCIT